jgi:acyl-homoserine lactone acylase PvdQ
MRLKLLALLLILHLTALGGTQPKKDKTGAQAEILWDTWGVPHIFAKDMNSAGRALGWGQMQNHGNRLLRAIAIARGRGATILKAWDRNVDADSLGAALFEFWAEERRGFPGFYAQPFDPGRPLETPRGLSDAKAAAEALDVAAQNLTKVAGRLDVPWGELYRLRRGKVDLPANGAGVARLLPYSRIRTGQGRTVCCDWL